MVFVRLRRALMRIIAPVCEREREQFRAMMRDAHVHVDDVNATLNLRSEELARMMRAAQERVKDAHSVPPRE